jgi:2-iminobutanoate/2-iminopropanoate deaminase
MARDGINSAQLTTPVGPYSHAINAGEFVFLSGQTAQDQTTGKLIEGDVAAQTEQVFANLKTCWNLVAKHSRMS